MTDLGSVVFETRKPMSIVVIVAGAVAIVGGAWSTSVTGSPVTLIGAGLFGAAVIWWGAIGSRRPFAIHERGVVVGGKQLAFADVKILWDGIIGLRGMAPGGIAGIAAATSWSELVLGDGTRAGAVRVDAAIASAHRAKIDDLIARASKAAVERERKALAGGGTYRVDSRDRIEVTATELRVGDAAIPHSALSISGRVAYRRGNDKPAASHDALAQDLLLRALVAGYGASVT